MSDGVIEFTGGWYQLKIVFSLFQNMVVRANTTMYDIGLMDGINEHSL